MLALGGSVFTTNGLISAATLDSGLRLLGRESAEEEEGTNLISPLASSLLPSFLLPHLSFLPLLISLRPMRAPQQCNVDDALLVNFLIR